MTWSIRRYRWIPAALASALLAGSALGVDLQNHKVAFSADTLFFGPGVAKFGDNTFGTFAQPTINNLGQVAFSANFTAATSFSPTGGGDGLWRFDPAAGNQLIAQTFGVLPPTTSLDDPFLSNNGSIAFRANLSGGSSGVIYRASPASAQDVASKTNVTGSEGPDLAGLSFAQVAQSANSMVFRNGHAAYLTNLTTGVGGVTFNNDDLLVRSDAGAQAVSYARQSITGANPLGPGVVGRTWQTNFTAMAVNNRGDIAFLSGFGNESTQFGEPSMFGKIDGPTGAVGFQAVANTTGATGPNIPGSPSSAYTFIQGSGRIDMNDAGDTVYFGRSGSSSPNVLAKRTNGGTTPVFLARNGNTLDGRVIGNFNASNDPIIAGDGTVYFQVAIGSANGLYKHTDLDGFELLALTNDIPLGLGDGVTRFSSFSSLAANASGDLAFYAQFNGTGITSANDEAIIAIREGVMSIVVREGDLYDVDPSANQDLRTIRNLVYPSQLVNTGGQDGRRSYINDYGDIVYGLTFTDFSSGIFITPNPVPEPAAALGLIAGLALLRRRSSTRK